MKRSAALKNEETHWSVTTPEDRAKIQEKISQAIRESKSQPATFQTKAAPEKEPGFAGKWDQRVHALREEWSERAGDLGQRAQSMGRAVKEQVAPNPNAELWKGLAAGLAAGLIGTVVMTGFMGLWNKTGELVEEKFEDRPGKQQQEQRGEEEPSTEKVASAISENVFEEELEGDTKKLAGNAVHYAFGTLIGGFYGALTELYPALNTGQGTLYSTAVWLGADELALPLLGFTPAPQERPVSEHVYGVAAHAVYGVVTETVRDALRGWMD